ncbi:hypothetical protein T439DRAFT_323477 [Meredithblackwellia eburnea MCA 4105]
MAGITSLRPLFKASSKASTSAIASSSRRSIHSRVQLPFPIQDGLDPFLSKNALKTVAVDWQEGVLDKLNQLVHGTEFQDLSVLETVKQTASRPEQALTFNYASEALNNSFFLSTLSPSPSPFNFTSRFGISLSKSTYRSLPTLISRFSAQASGLHPSSGAYLWLATDQQGNIGVLGTYAGGTLLVHQRQQMGNTLNSNGTVLGELSPEQQSSTSAGVEADSVDAADSPTPEKSGKSSWKTVPSKPLARKSGQDGGIVTNLVSGLSLSSGSVGKPGQKVLPLACLSVHPHCYMHDYGLWGREEYVKRWWSQLDWQKVEDSYAKFVREKSFE